MATADGVLPVLVVDTALIGMGKRICTWIRGGPQPLHLGEMRLSGRRPAPRPIAGLVCILPKRACAVTEQSVT
jgi:hypothetical protein